MKWLQRLIGPTVDYDTYWRVLHRMRREKKLSYWRRELDKRVVRLRIAEEMVAYYIERLSCNAAPQENRPDALLQEGANVTPAVAAPDHNYHKHELERLRKLLMEHGCGHVLMIFDGSS